MNNPIENAPQSSVVADSPLLPQLGGLNQIRELLTSLAENRGMNDQQLVEALLLGGLMPLPLLGRKIAVSGSAQQQYLDGPGGKPILGIGDAVAEGMLRYGGDTVVNSFTPSMNTDRLNYLQSLGRRCDYIQADMSTEDGARNFVRSAFEMLGGLDVLVLNAGTYIDPEFPKFDSERLMRTFALNVLGPMAAINEYIELVGDTVKFGRIIVTTSINAQLSEAQHGYYDASKGALESFIRATALDLAKSGIDIRINGVAPGLIYTPLTYRAITEAPEAHQRINQSIPLGIGWAQQMVMPYLFLAMPMNNYMTGTVLDVSGGLRVSQATESYPALERRG